ncbi:MAG: P-II family nitrogen regulator [Clostridiales bacterium]|nr:P-II family nitrogen regulator [Clostridiales bacterium]
METLFYAIVNRDKANAVWHKAQECGATEGTIFLAEGTVRSKLLEKMGLTETHKAILMISATCELCDTLHELVSETFKFSERNKGIAFSVPFRRWRKPDSGQQDSPQKNIINAEYYCIMTIVDKGRSKDCLKAARAAGAKGGTLIHGRGAGIPTEYYYPLVIEPQKDIVMIVAAKDKADAIRDRISCELELEKTGNGIIFTLPVLRTCGLTENKSEERKGVAS